MSKWQENHSPSIYCSVSVSTSKFPCSMFRCLNSLFSGLFQQILKSVERRKSTIKARFAIFPLHVPLFLGWWFRFLGKLFLPMLEIHSRNVNTEHWIYPKITCNRIIVDFGPLRTVNMFMLFHLPSFLQRFFVSLRLYQIRFVGFNMHMAQCSNILGTLSHTFKAQISLCHEKVNDPISCYK